MSRRASASEFASFNSRSFQFTLPHGERLLEVGGILRPSDVSIHAPAWGATPSAYGFHASRNVSIHAPAWGATPRRGKLDPVLCVSIHAPAWGATPLSPLSPPEDEVSIHAPAWGATKRRSRQTVIQKFQFTLPHGERPVPPRPLPQTQKVSIHAPAWGATCQR